MRKSFAVLALGAMLLAWGAAGETLEEVLAKNYEARGGLDKITAVKSARLTGKMTMGQGMEAPFLWQWKRPNKLRLEFTIQGMTGVQAYDGTTGWMLMPFMGKTEPEKMSQEDADNVKEQADFDGELVNWKEKGYKVELLGKEPVEGTDAWKLKVTKPNGDTTTVYLDAEYYLEIKSEGKRTIRGQEVEYESSVGDYKEVDGLMIPHSITSKAKGTPSGQTITIDKVELNVPIDDAVFAMPEVAKKDAPAPK
jgi:outer membrane lipoprotein-sorting protein